jgi:hypothetical protein
LQRLLKSPYLQLLMHLLLIRIKANKKTTIQSIIPIGVVVFIGLLLYNLAYYTALPLKSEGIFFKIYAQADSTNGSTNGNPSKASIQNSIDSVGKKEVPPPSNNPKYLDINNIEKVLKGAGFNTGALVDLGDSQIQGLGRFLKAVGLNQHGTQGQSGINGAIGNPTSSEIMGLSRFLDKVGFNNIPSGPNSGIQQTPSQIVAALVSESRTAENSTGGSTSGGGHGLATSLGIGDFDWNTLRVLDVIDRSVNTVTSFVSAFGSLFTGNGEGARHHLDEARAAWDNTHDRDTSGGVFHPLPTETVRPTSSSSPGGSTSTGTGTGTEVQVRQLGMKAKEEEVLEAYQSIRKRIQRPREPTRVLEAADQSIQMKPQVL